MEARCNKIKEKIQNEIDKIDSIDSNELSTFKAVLKTLSAPIRLVTSMGKGIYSAVTSLAARIKKGNEQYNAMKKFQNEL